MSNQKKVRDLQDQISVKHKEMIPITEELHRCVTEDNSFIYSAEYGDLKKRKENLLQDIQVLNATIYKLKHSYSFTLQGHLIGPIGNGTTGLITETITSFIDCNLGDTRELDKDNQVHIDLLNEIRSKYKSYFEEGQFTVLAIFQHK